MKKSLVAVSAVTILSAGCATHFGGLAEYRDFGVRTTNAASVSVEVVQGTDKPHIVVSQEPIYVQQSTDNAIYWSLPRGGPYYFLPKSSPNPGIAFENPQMPQTDCNNHKEDKWTYVCTYKKANKKKYLYVVRVTRDGSNIVTSDPTVMND